MMMSIMLYVLIGLLCAMAVHALVPEQPTEAIPVVAAIGVFGAWVGGYCMGSMGPSLMGVSLFPPILGAAGLIFLVYVMHEIASTNNWL